MSNAPQQDNGQNTGQDNGQDNEQNNNPVFSSESYTAEVSEGNGRNPIITISATAVDSNDGNGDRITYSIIGGNDDNLFSIGASNGKIRLVSSSLDYESVSSTRYTLIVEASDGTNSARVEVVIDILDVNDNTPTLTYSGGEIHFKENASGVISYEFFEISDADSDDANEFSFEITGAHGDKFDVIDVGGIWALTIKDEEEFDAEEIDEVKLKIRVNDGAHTSNEIDVTVKIDDSNDEEPIVQPIGLAVSVAEDIAVGSYITRVFAVDDDANSVLTYRIIDSDAAAFFAIDPRHGVITLKKALDYESNTNHNFVVEVWDGVHSTEATVTVSVRNKVEVAPVLSSTGTARIMENVLGAPTGLNLNVIDSETDAELEFTIAGAEAGQFEIVSDGSTGWLLKLTANATFDYEQAQSIPLTITANNGTLDSNTLEVAVAVVDANDNAPQFSKDKYRTSISEDAAPGSAVSMVMVSDVDASNQSITLSIIDGNDDGRFSIDNDGTLRTAKALDYETTTKYDLTIEAVDDAGNSSTSEVKLDVLDVNDNAPVLTASATTASIVENELLALTGIIFEVADRDNKSYYYEDFTISSDDAIDYSDHFRVAEVLIGNEGALQLFTKGEARYAIDYETSQVINLKIKAHDDHFDSNEIAVTLTVLNVNDNAPTLNITSTHQDNDGNHYGQVMELDSTAPLTGYTMRITDLDGNLTAPSDFQIEMRDNFRSTLEIADKFEFVRDGNQWLLQLKRGEVISFDEQLQSTDEAKITGTLDVHVFDGEHWSESASLTIQVLGINNNPPVLTTLDASDVSVVEGRAGVATGIYFIVSDIDGGGLSGNDFTITGDQAGKFTMATEMVDYRDSDRIFALKLKETLSLDHDDGDTLNLKVKAHDGVFDSEIIDVVVRVHERNDNLTFAQKLYSAFHPENAPVDPNDTSTSALIQVAALSQDETVQISYSITAGNDDGLFAINADSGMISLRNMLDAESAARHTLTITATAKDDSTNSATTELVVYVQNKEDAAVAFPDDDITIFIAEDADVGTLLTTLNAANADIGNRAIYNIVYEGGEDEFLVRDADYYFELNQVTGALRTNRALDYETKQSHILKVSVNESTFADVTVFVTDLNDNAPTVINSFYTSPRSNLLAENVAGALANGSKIEILIGAIVGDLDSDAVNNFTYTIGGARAELFEMVATSHTNALGERLWQIKLKDEVMVDYEETEKFDLTVRFNDGVHDSEEIEFTLWVSDENDASQLGASSYAFSISETALIGARISQITATDPDKDAVLVYSISGGNDDGLFAIDAETGILRVAKSLDAAMMARHNLTVSVSDRGVASTASVAIEVAASDGIFTATGALTGAVADDPAATSAIVATANLSNPRAPDGTAHGRALGAGQFSIRGADAPDAPDAPQQKIGDYGTLTFTPAPNGNSGNWRYELDRSLASIRAMTASDMATETFNLVYTTIGNSPEAYTAPLTITITGADNPMSFTEPVAYHFSLDENAGADTPIGTVLANDPELAIQPSIAYSITSGDTDRFAINADSGMISLIGAVDFETAARHNLEITAISADATATVNVQINVQDINEAPSFANSLYTGTISEAAALNSEITTITATDIDAGEVFTYAISGGNDDGIFAIDASTGVVSLARAGLDFETAPSHDLTIEVTDSGGLTASTLLRISITDANDTPQFAQSIYHVDLPEDSRTGDVLATLTASDGDAGDSLTYSISAGNDDGLFAIDANTGVLSYIGNIFLGYETAQQSFDVTIMASDGTATATTIARIAVSDVNEFAPIFTPATITKLHTENTPFTYDVSAGVSDGDGAAQLTYSIKSGTGAELFEIGAETGILRNIEMLDYEGAHGTRFPLNIEVSDGDNTANLTFNIFLEDVNDNPLYLLASSPIGTVAENTRPNLALVQIEISDADSAAAQAAIEGQITGDQADKFMLNMTTLQGKNYANLFLKPNETLDYEEASLLRLAVSISDGVFTSNSQDVLLVVRDVDEPLSLEGALSGQVQDAPNPSAPIVATGAITGLYDPEGITSVPMGSLALKADTDTNGAYGDFRFTLDAGETNSGVWTYTLDTTATNTRALTDGRIVTETFTLVYTTTSGEAYEEDVVITIIGGADPVVFSQPNGYAYALSEDAQSGTEVGKVEASDVDVGAVHDIKYVIESGNDDDIFAIDADTGIISIIAALDYETAEEHILVVKAEDKGVEAGTATAEVTIAVSDVNDNAPMFEAATIAVTVDEDAAMGHEVVQVVASDIDTNTTLTYNITAGNEAGHFSIDESDGTISVAAALDFEVAPMEYLLKVEASDGTNSNTQDVSITLNDINEAPEFAQSIYTATLVENVAVGTIVATITAEDIDAGSVLNYRISGGNQNGLFAIDATSGAVRVARALDFETASVHRLEIEASDADDATTTAREGNFAATELRVSVTDIGAQGISFSGDFAGTITEDMLASGATELTASGAVQVANQPAGTTLTFLTASQDSTSTAVQVATVNDKLQMTTSYGMLEFDAATGAWEYRASNSNPLVQALRTGESVVENFVMAAQVDGESKKTTIAITINGVDEVLHFVDENGARATDFMPELTLDVNDAGIGTLDGAVVSAGLAGRIGGLQTAANLRFAFDEEVSASIKSLFLLNSSTGALVYRGTKDNLHDYGGEITLALVASAPAETTKTLPFTAVVKPNLFFDDVGVYALEVSEHAEQGAVVGAMAVTNQGNDEALTYRLVGDAPNSGFGPRFSIDASGVIRLNVALDFEVTSSYSLAVEARTTGGDTIDKAITIQVANADDGIAVIDIDQSAPDLVVGTILTARVITEDPDGVEDASSALWQWFYKSAPDTPIATGEIYTIREEDRGEKLGVKRVYEDSIGDTSTTLQLKTPVKRVHVNPENPTEQDHHMKAKDGQASTIIAGDGADDIQDGTRNDVIIGGKGDDKINLGGNTNHDDEDEVIYTMGDHMAKDGGDQITGFTRGRDKFIFAMDSTPESAGITDMDAFLDYVRNGTEQVNDDQFLVQLNFIFLPDDTPMLDGLLFHFSNADYFDGGRVSVPMVMLSFAESMSKDEVIAVFGSDKSDVHANVNGNGILTNLDYLDDLLGGDDALGFQINEVV